MVDEKTTELTSTDATIDSDFLYFVDDPGGTPVSKARPISDFIADHTAGDTDVLAGTSTTTLITPAAFGATWGSDFPASPTSDDSPFFRSDLGFACFHDGTRWLTQHVMATQVVDRTGVANAEERVLVLSDTAWDIYITDIQVNTYVDTTNNSSDYWTLEIQGQDLARTSESVAFTVNTSADAADTWIDHSGPATDASPTNQITLISDVSSNDSPGTLDYTVQFYYRYIIT
jgi:hypothetical protein